jgi:hypothetical protein
MTDPEWKQNACAGTPHHKDVRVRLEPATPDEAAASEEASRRVGDLVAAAAG